MLLPLPDQAGLDLEVTDADLDAIALDLAAEEHDARPLDLGASFADVFGAELEDAA